MKRLSVLVVAILVLSALLSACGGGAASDPAGVVKDMMQAVTNKQFDKIADFACAAQKDQIKNALDPASQLGATGIDVNKMLDAMTISFSNADISKVSESGDKATVQVKGKLAIKVDREKFKSFLADVMKAQGQTLSDDMLNTVLDQAASQFENGQDINSQVDMVRENGKWLVCSTLQ
jgi:hypothetical protein